MAAVSEDRLVDVLKGLDPVSRALLDLSVRRGIPDDEIAKVVGAEEGSVAERRDEVLVEVAQALGLDGDPQELVAVQEALKQIDWRVRAARDRAPGGPPGEAERQGAPRRSKPTDLVPDAPPERSRWVLLAALVLSLFFNLRRRS